MGTVGHLEPLTAGVREQERRRLASPNRLRSLFAPRSVALVGASESSSWSRLVVQSLSTAALPGAIIAVNPRHESVLGVPTVARLEDLDEPVDLAFCQVATERVEAVLESARAVGIRNLVVLASGYGEGGEDGRRREAALVDRAIELDLTLLGPNTLGYINSHAQAAPFGLPISVPPRKGSVAVVLQSGALSSAVLDFANRHGIGVSLLTSMGNEAVVTATDVIAHLLEDQNTRAIALFLESIRDPERFVELAERALSVGKPLVVLKVGRSAAGRASALAHTGAVAGDDAVVDAVFRRAGVVRVNSLEEMLVTADLLSQGLQLGGTRMGVVSASGGACDIIADRAHDEGLQIPEFTPQTERTLVELLPSFASPKNPLDVTGFVLARPPAADGRGLGDLCLEAVVDDPAVDLVFNSLVVPAQEPPDPDALEARLVALAKVAHGSTKPVVHYSTTCTDQSPYSQELLARHDLRVLPGIDLGISAVGHAVRWGRARQRLLERNERNVSAERAAAPVSPGSRRRRTGTWSEQQARDLAAGHGVPLVPTVLVTSAEEARAAARSIGLPVALKICSASLPHKSDIGGVELGIDDLDIVGASYERVRAAGQAHADDIEGVLVAPMRSGGLELFAGVTVDPVFGPVLALGLGGVFVETLGDVSLRTLPVDVDDIEEMLDELRGGALLRGARGTAPVDLHAVAEAVVSMTRAATSLGADLRAMEVNPWWVRGSMIEALDVLVVTGTAGEGIDDGTRNP